MKSGKLLAIVLIAGFLLTGCLVPPGGASLMQEEAILLETQENAIGWDINSYSPIVISAPESETSDEESEESHQESVPNESKGEETSVEESSQSSDPETSADPEESIPEPQESSDEIIEPEPWEFDLDKIEIKEPVFGTFPLYVELKEDEDMANQIAQIDITSLPKPKSFGNPTESEQEEILKGILDQIDRYDKLKDAMELLPRYLYGSKGKCFYGTCQGVQIYDCSLYIGGYDRFDKLRISNTWKEIVPSEETVTITEEDVRAVVEEAVRLKPMWFKDQPGVRLVYLHQWNQKKKAYDYKLCIMVTCASGHYYPCDAETHWWQQVVYWYELELIG